MGLSERQELCSVLLALLEEFPQTSHEELALNLACAATNLTCYQTAGNALLSGDGPARLLAAVVPMLLSSNEEAVVEAARALGNMSRLPDARALLVASRAVEALVVLLDHSGREVIYSATGALINLSGDTDSRAAAVEAGCLPKLVDALERAGSAFAKQGGEGRPPALDVPLALVACKALFNIMAEARGEGSEGGATRMPALTLAEGELLVSLVEHVTQSEDPAYAELASVAARYVACVRKAV